MLRLLALISVVILIISPLETKLGNHTSLESTHHLENAYSESPLAQIVSSTSDTIPFYEIKVEEGDWVEYAIVEVINKAMIPVEFEASFPKAWTSLREGSSIMVEVLEKKVIRFGNYSKEFAIMNITINGQPVIPFWVFDTIRSIEQLPLDGYTFFMPTDESYWNDFRELLGWWASKAVTHGFQIVYDVQKNFYRFRVDHLLIGWLEVSAKYEEYYGVLSEFSLTFALNQEFVQEISEKIGTITVDGEPFQIEAEKIYGIKIAISDTNIPQLLNSLQFGRNLADTLNDALEKEAIGAFITFKTLPEEKELTFRVETLTPKLELSVSTTSDKMIVEANSTVSDGKVLIVNIRDDVFSIQWSDELQVLFDGERIGGAFDYNDVLNPHDEDSPEYFVLIGSKFTQVVVSVPRFSVHVIEITKVPSATAQFYLYASIIGIACIAILSGYLVRRRIVKHRIE